MVSAEKPRSSRSDASRTVQTTAPKAQEIELALKITVDRNAWNYNSWTPCPHLNPFCSARANKHLPTMWVADSPMVITLPGLRRKAGLKQSPYLMAELRSLFISSNFSTEAMMQRGRNLSIRPLHGLGLAAQCL